MAAAEVQISETETPLHKLETVYRRVGEALRTASFPPSALRPVLDSWLFTLETDATTADPYTARLLGIPHGAPVLRIRQVIYSTKGKTALYVLGLYRSDRHTLLIRRFR